MSSVSEYLDYLKQYRSIAEVLHRSMDDVIKLKSVELYGLYFEPTETTVRQQIEHWPATLPSWPPALWVEPSRGKFECYGEEWEFAFHGQGVSFIQMIDQKEVSLEYTSEGEIGITEYNFELFLKSINKESIGLSYLPRGSESLFVECVRQQFLLEKPARGGSDSETFVLRSASQ